MKEFELSKYDFEALDKALAIALSSRILANSPIVARLEQLKDKFAKAHTAILFIEEGE